MRALYRIAGLVAATFLVRWLLRRLWSSEADERSPRREGPHIVVAGAGFAGIAALAELTRRMSLDGARVTLIDQHNYHLFTPLLYQVATGAVDATNLTYSLRRFCAPRRIAYRSSTIYGINPLDRVLTSDSGQIPYDYLALGLGSQTNYFGMDEIRERSFGLKTVPQGVALRERVIRNFEEAARSQDGERRRRLLSFIVVGAGATGIELTGSLHDLVHHNLLHVYPDLDQSEVRIVLLEAGESVLPGIDPRIGEMALERFRKVGIDVRLNTLVAGVREGQVITRDESCIPGDVIIWTAGIRPHPVAAGLAVE